MKILVKTTDGIAWEQTNGGIVPGLNHAVNTSPDKAALPVLDKLKKMLQATEEHN